MAAEYPPTSVSFPGTTNGEAGLPQVMNRTPASYSNFYAPAGGINFTATTLGGGNVTSVKLFLNDVDVSSGLTISALSNSRTVSFPGSGLTANTVYDARIELANASGQNTTNIWTFDTFSDAYLTSTNRARISSAKTSTSTAVSSLMTPSPPAGPPMSPTTIMLVFWLFHGLGRPTRTLGGLPTEATSTKAVGVIWAWISGTVTPPPTT